MECIVLAGGLGTRLQSVLADIPKCMALVNNKPFLHYIFDYLEQQACTRVILSLGYKHEHVVNWLTTQQRSFTINYVIEQEPLGTGGGIQLAMQEATDHNVLVLNGDTMFRVDIDALYKFHMNNNAETTLALKPMKDFERYGAVRVNEEHRILSFEEKKYYGEGLINGGIYIVNREQLMSKNLPAKYSFEKDYFEAYVHEGNICGFVSDAYFIDIGIPSDYEQAQRDFKTQE